LDLILETLGGFFVSVNFFNTACSGRRRCSDINGVNGSDRDSGECTRDFVEEVISCSLGLNQIGRLQRSGSQHHLECTLVHRDVARAHDGSAILHSDFEGLWVTGNKVVTFVLYERVTVSALHAGTVRITTVPARVTLSSVLTLRGGLCLCKGVDRGCEGLDLGH
jgi:hypothetical protein